MWNAATEDDRAAMIRLLSNTVDLDKVRDLIEYASPIEFIDGLDEDLLTPWTPSAFQSDVPPTPKDPRPTVQTHVGNGRRFALCDSPRVRRASRLETSGSTRSGADQAIPPLTEC